MKKLLSLTFALLVFMACDDSGFNNRNPFIPNYSFSETINMTLPSYQVLTYPGNAIYYPGGGARGLIVFNTGSGYRAYDAACPNQAMAPCSTLQLNGIEAVCPCDEVAYNLYTGQAPEQEYPMKPYRVSVQGNVLRVFN